MLAALLTLALAAEPMQLSPGAQEVLRVAGVTRVGVGDPAVVDVTPTGRGELLVTAKSRGRTTLTLWTSRGLTTRQVVVDDGRTTELGRQVKSLVNPALQVAEYSGVTVIDGLLESPDELRRLEQLVSHRADVKVLARLDPRVLPAIAQNITAALHKEGLKHAQALVLGGRLVLEGSVADERERQKAQLIADGLARDVLTRL